jgi:hypothetical protein
MNTERISAKYCTVIIYTMPGVWSKTHYEWNLAEGMFKDDSGRGIKLMLNTLAMPGVNR